MNSADMLTVHVCILSSQMLMLSAFLSTYIAILFNVPLPNDTSKYVASLSVNYQFVYLFF